MIRTSLLDQFRTFYFQNYPDDMESLIECFSVFGGVEWSIDTTFPIESLIEKHILQNYETLNHTIDTLVLHSQETKRLLRALAKGDRRIFSAFNKAGLNNGNGGALLNFLEEKGLIHLEYSREQHPRKQTHKSKLKREEARHRISHKVLFTYPFLRFWFYFIVPHHKQIAQGNFKEVLQEYQLKKNSYTSLVYEELSEILLNYHLRDEQIETTGSYWDAKTEIDILLTTRNANVYVAECKWSNHKINKKELHKLKDKCQKLGISPTQIIFFAKRGFSNELLQLRSKELALFSSEDFQALLKPNSTHNTQCLIRLLK